MSRFIKVFGTIMFAFVLANSAFGRDEDVFVGTIEKIDHVAKTIAIKTADGTVKVFKWTAKATSHGVKSAAMWTAHEARVGEHVVVHAAKIAGEDTIKGIEWFGKGTAKVVEGTVKTVGRGGKKVALTVAGGAEEVYDVSEHAVVKTGRGIVHASKFVGKETEKGFKGTVHIVEHGGKKFVHFIHHHVEG